VEQEGRVQRGQGGAAGDPINRGIISGAIQAPRPIQGVLERNQYGGDPQAEEFDRILEDDLNRIYKFFATVQQSDSWAILRQKEINEWIIDVDYYAVMPIDPERHEDIAERNRLIADLD
jgi:hypothetical protein